MSKPINSLIDRTGTITYDNVDKGRPIRVITTWGRWVLVEFTDGMPRGTQGDLGEPPNRAYYLVLHLDLTWPRADT